MPRFALYHYPGCFYCGRVVHAMKKLGVDAEMRNIYGDAQWMQDLIDYDGRRTVPVLRIEHDDGRVEMMRESADIIRYLESTI